MRPFASDATPSNPKLTIDSVKWHKVSVTVQVSDTDYGGGVYHGRYFSLYHQARDRFIEDLGVSCISLIQQGLALSVAELHTFFVKSVFYGDAIEIQTRVLWLGNRSMGVAQDMFGTDPVTGETTLRNRVEMNIVGTCKGKAVPLPERLVLAIKAYYGL